MSLLTSVLVAGALMLTGCDNEPPPPSNPADKYAVLVPPPETQPKYTFAPGVRAKHPDVAGFVKSFLETCLNGDYTGYKQLVSRRRDPESQDRFTKIFHSMSAVTVESIEPVKLREIPPPVFLVVSVVDFLPGSKVALRERNRNIAILVFKESGQWRMAPAPSELQPADEQPPSAAETVAEPAAPDYPWDEDDDH